MIKKFIFNGFFLVLALSANSAIAQTNAPSVADNADPRDTNIKMRSVDLERVERDGNKNLNNKKSDNKKEAPARNELTAKFPQVKEDFEGIQLAQTEIIKAYSTGAQIDYALIGKSAAEINEKAQRLDENLFPALANAKLNEKKEPAKVVEKSKPLRDQIIELDEAIGRLTTNKVFANLNVIDPEDAEKAHAELVKIQALSAELIVEAKKMQ